MAHENNPKDMEETESQTQCKNTTQVLGMRGKTENIHKQIRMTQNNTKQCKTLTMHQDLK